ncbi:MAG TPA: rRNA maturation RNase YbeY [Pyrinomonadaceae bacterium]|nr:rRNA maturation RNase YbeY [Pyrinomonadaceae bacterium]
MVEVVNRQRRLKLDTEAWSTFADRALDAIGKSESSATIAFVSDKRIRALNRQFRGVDKATDVLSFPAEDKFNLGDVAVSVDTAEVQAKANGLTLTSEISQLILHGLLHLCGYDHETDNGEMNRLELRMRKRLGI